MRYTFLFLISLISISNLFAQSRDEWFPSDLNIQPFTANFIEPKAGFSYVLGEKEIELDIGTTSDIYHYFKDNTELSLGGDLFTYTRLRGEKDFHFPVDAVDYLFGVNAGYKISVSNKEYGFRFRLSHISAHFADGHYDTGSQEWRNGRTPTVYSREFIELFPFYKIDRFRVYLGLTYIFHVTPKEVGKGIYQTGFDYYFENLFKQNISPFLAYDFKLDKIGKYTGNNIISAGIKFGKYNTKGFSISFNYFSGKSIHGEYFDINEHYSTIGLNLDF
jgi:Protein of unknown function (DUF1207)